MAERLVDPKLILIRNLNEAEKHRGGMIRAKAFKCSKSDEIPASEGEDCGLSITAREGDLLDDERLDDYRKACRVEKGAVGVCFITIADIQKAAVHDADAPLEPRRNPLDHEPHAHAFSDRHCLINCPNDIQRQELATAAENNGGWRPFLPDPRD